MNLKGIKTILQTPQLWSAWKLRRDLRAFLRVHFLYAAFDSGLLQALQKPVTRQRLTSELGVRRVELLEPLLELGVVLKELAVTNGSYRLRGKRSKVLATAPGDALAAFIQESVVYHGSVYRDLASRLKGAELGDYLASTGKLVARSSRIVEPYVAGFAQDAVKFGKPVRLLEVGCGSGVYLRHAAEANSNISGVAIDIQEDVVAHARENLVKWGIDKRFEVQRGNILAPAREWVGRFDLVTLYNNIYYFPPVSRVELFRGIKSLLGKGGSLAIVSLFRAPTLESVNFDLVLRSTQGCAPLPELSELTQQLREAGFTTVEKRRLLPRQWLYGVIARS